MSQSTLTSGRVAIMELLSHDPDTMRQFIFGGQTEAPENKLQMLTTLVGMTAGAINDEGWTRANLRKIYGYTSGWLAAMNIKRGQSAIMETRDLQNAMFAEGDIPVSMACKTHRNHLKLALLVGALGQIADHVRQFSTGNTSIACKENITEAVTELAALAVGWLESFQK